MSAAEWIRIWTESADFLTLDNLSQIFLFIIILLILQIRYILSHYVLWFNHWGSGSIPICEVSESLSMGVLSKDFDDVNANLIAGRDFR